MAASTAAGASWVSSIPAVIAALVGESPEAIDAGLVAAAEVDKTAVKDALRGGYTSGEFVTGINVNAVERTEPFDEHGVRTIRVYSSQTDPNYPVFWELGHVNVFVRAGTGPAASSVASRRQGQYVRVEKWRPALVDNRDRAAAAFSRVALATIEAAAMTGGGTGSRAA